MDFKIASAILVGVGWVLALCLHEFGHAIVAYWGGDKSVKDKGYLTMNPLRYTDPGLTLVIPLIILMIGGIALPGAAVYINHAALRNRLWRSAVALAGPVFSYIALCIFAAPFALGIPGDVDNWFWSSIALLAYLQGVAIVLNLLPIPPLDGYGVIEPWLPSFLRGAMNSFGRYGIWILFGVLWFNPDLNSLLFDAAGKLIEPFNIPPDSWQHGYRLFMQQKYLLMAVILVVLMISRKKK